MIEYVDNAPPIIGGDPSKVPKIVCITGKAGAGKDTLAQYITDYLNYNGHPSVIAHNADYLKMILTHYFGWRGNKDENGRRLLQTVGTDYMRKIDPDIHVKFLYDTLSMFRGKWEYIVIPDCRFPNEVDFWREKGYFAPLIRIVRKDRRGKEIIDEFADQHISENSMSKYTADATVENDNSLLAVRLKAERLCEELLIER